jgi:uroporphyrinogen-III synthase
MMHTPRVLYTGLRAPGKVAGVRITHLPLLITEPLPIDRAALQAHLDHGPCGLVFASPRAPRLIQALDLSSGGHAHQGWAVGVKTAEVMREALPWLAAIHTPPEDAQHFRALCDAMRAAHSAGALPHTLLALALEDSPRDLGEALSDLADVAVHTIEIYATHARPTEELRAALQAAGPHEWLVITSPRGAEALYAAIGPARPDAKLVAIGPTTAAALEALGWPPDFTPPTPALDALWPLMA